jgi:hypothetical protein
LVSHIKGRTQAEGVPENSSEKTSGPERENVKGSWKNCTMRSFMIYTSCQIFLG